MPVQFFNNQRVVRCVNHGLGDHALAPGQISTMHIAQWHALTQVVPPNAGAPMHFNPNAGIPVKCCICQVCGYVELYSGMVQNPNVWGGPNG